MFRSLVYCIVLPMNTMNAEPPSVPSIGRMLHMLSPSFNKINVMDDQERKDRSEFNKYFSFRVTVQTLAADEA